MPNKGKVKVFSKQYKSFTTGKSDRQDNEERLFLCECNNYKKKQSTLFVGFKKNSLVKKEI